MPRSPPIAPQIPTSEPDVLTAGVSWQWSTSLPDFPVSELWEAKYYLTGKSSLSFSATGNSGTGLYDVDVLPSVTKDVDEGTYRWTLRFSLDFSDPDEARYDAASGTFQVLGNPAVQTDTDERSHAELMVERLEAEIEARLTGDGSGHNDYTIGSRSISKIPLTELVALKNRYEARVVIERDGKLPDLVAAFVRA